ncbi:MAG: hypothetical protein J6C26_08400 [Clostridia bacterium]|nr:hypothetical protein [Clostridia bacterium]
MKKTMKLTLLVCLALIACMLMFTACGGDSESQLPSDMTNGSSKDESEAHVHSFGEWTTVKEATCSRKGEQERTCACGEKETQSVEALEHTKETIPAIEPTKLKEGLTEGSKCSVCQKILVEQEKVPPLGPPTDVWNGSIATEFAGGSGTESDPYLISTGAQLAFLAKSVNSSKDNAYYNKYYKLTNSIDLKGQEWDPIGSYSDKEITKAFQGFFDGDGYEVRNFKISKSKSPYYYGLFGKASNGDIRNLGVTDFTINVSGQNLSCAGGIAGSSASPITNCYTDGIVNLTVKKEGKEEDVFAFVGGLIGDASGTLTNCYTKSSVIATIKVEYGRAECSGDLFVGGLVGRNYEGAITSCYALGDVTATVKSDDAYAYTYAGGLVGYVRDGMISKSYATGNVSANSSITGYEFAYAYAGGLVGDSFGSIENCYATGDATAIASGKNSYMRHSYAGGLVGRITSETITNCYATGNISANATGPHRDGISLSGGLVGYAEKTTTKNSYATGNVTCLVSGSSPYGRAGSFMGNSASGTITNYYHYEKQIVKLNNETIKSTANTACTQEQLNDATFYTGTLGWDGSIWNFSDLDFAKHKTPLLNLGR